MIKLTEQEGRSPDMLTENLEALKGIFPEAFCEEGVDFDVLRQLLGNAVVDSQEKYGLTWLGKKKARQIALLPSFGTLRPCRDESVDWDTTHNLFIEGDNLEVLKLLQKSYASKVKLIYIDPPYNTGKDFIFPDKFQDHLDTYLRYSGQKDDEGFNISSNTEGSGRYHTNWLNMIYPRLKLARNLLRDDGLIVISIDNHEISNLKKCCDEIYGEENILAIVANINNPKGRSDDKFFATSHEYLVFVAKNKRLARMHGFDPEENVTRRYNKVDNSGRKYREIDLRKTGDADRREDRPDMFYYFYYDESSNELSVSKKKRSGSNDIEIIPLRADGVEGRWRWGFESAQVRLAELSPKLMPNRGIWGVFEKDYLEGRRAVKPTTAWSFKDVNSERGSEQFVNLGFEKEIFPRPKPIGTLKRVIQISTLPDEETVILDFFAGSGTLAQAAFELMKDATRQLKWILVQLPEKLDQNNKEQKSAYRFCEKNKLPHNIAEISKARIRRAATRFKKKFPGDGGDFGFKVFKLDTSNIRAWNPDLINLEQSLLEHVEQLVEGRTEEDVICELMLKRGGNLTDPIEKKSIDGKTVYSIGNGSLIACLDQRIARDQIEGIAMGIIDWHKALAPVGDAQVVFRDSAFDSDIAKTNMTTMLVQHGIAHVRSL